MEISALKSAANFSSVAQRAQQGPPIKPAPDSESGPLRATFDKFVGETFYSQMLGAMRKTVHKAAYFDGGRAEEVFRGQLDQIIAGKLAEASASDFTGPMFELFQLNRS